MVPRVHSSHVTPARRSGDHLFVCSRIADVLRRPLLPAAIVKYVSRTRKTLSNGTRRKPPCNSSARRGGRVWRASAARIPATITGIAGHFAPGCPTSGAASENRTTTSWRTHFGAAGRRAAGAPHDRNKSCGTATWICRRRFEFDRSRSGCETARHLWLYRIALFCERYPFV